MSKSFTAGQNPGAPMPATHDLADFEEPVGPAATEGAEAPGPRRKRKWLGRTALAVLLVGTGAVSAVLLTDPTASDEYAALSAELNDVSADLEDLESRYTRLSSGISNREDAVAEKEEAQIARGLDLVKREEAVKAREEAVTGAEEEKAANTISDGTWTVGRDIAPGTYRSSGEVGARCYWAVLRSGTNGSDIVENDIPGGGRPMVTLAEGQDFNSARCGTWEKQ